MVLEKIKVSMFKDRKSNIPAKTINLWEWLLLENEYTPHIERIRQTSNEEECKLLKIKLPAITPGGMFSRRRADCLTEPTNLICIDIDGKDNPSILDMEKLKRHLGKLPYIMYCGLSASGTGVFCIIPYPDYNNHKLYFNALEQEFNEMGIIIDSSCSDICRLRFYSYDDEPYVNPKAKLYTATSERNHVTEKKRVSERLLFQKIENFQQRDKPLKNIPLIMTPILERIELNIIDITVNGKRWFEIGCSLAGEFGEEGRYIFHAISKYYHAGRYKYTEEETNEMYDNCLQSWHKYNYGIGTFYYWMKEYGIL